MKPNIEDHIFWCKKQKRGIKVEKPNENLCKAYIKKSKSALNMLNSAIEQNEPEWIATTAYYARYFAFYALLQKCGIKSEIHDCTISLMGHLFVNMELIKEEMYKEMLLAKELRTDVQYYVTEELDYTKLKKDAKTAGDFVLEIERVIENINQEQINEMRETI